MARKAVEEGEARWLTAFNGGDAAGVAAVYAPEARLMPPNADILEGRNAIEAFGGQRRGPARSARVRHAASRPSGMTLHR